MSSPDWAQQLVTALTEICRFQTQYASENTEAMQERGRLIRRELPDLLRVLQPALSAELGPFGADLGIGASDGIGRKTEAPWVRIFSREMSPRPTEGFYIVIHFAADGSAVFITLGCGSTVWAGGDLRPVTDVELRRRTDWARSVVTERFGDLAPFTDEIHLGAKAPLPRTFEKATALAKRIAVDALDADNVVELLLSATARLRLVYEAQAQGRDMASADIVELHLEGLSRPEREIVGAGQGFGLTGPERRAVELRAMTLARTWLEVEGYKVKDTSRVSPFDFLATRGDESLKVEVKGTTSDSPAAIFMTRNEVELHRREAGATALLVVSRIRLNRTTDPPTATEGVLIAEIEWNIEAWDLTPLAYRVTRKPSSSLA